jgi:hypothetical protein
MGSLLKKSTAPSVFWQLGLRPTHGKVFARTALHATGADISLTPLPQNGCKEAFCIRLRAGLAVALISEAMVTTPGAACNGCP